LPGNPSWAPFEEGQVRVFRAANRADDRTSFWLSIPVAVPIMLLISLAAYIALARLPASWDPRDVLLLYCFVGMLGSFLSNVYGWFATGVSRLVAF
jgi:cytochrome bd-type quinol oxidase subunit 1